MHLVTVTFDDHRPAVRRPASADTDQEPSPACAVGQRGQVRQGWVERQPDGATVHSGLGVVGDLEKRARDVRLDPGAGARSDLVVGGVESQASLRVVVEPTAVACRYSRKPALRIMSRLTG